MKSQDNNDLTSDFINVRLGHFHKKPDHLPSLPPSAKHSDLLYLILPGKIRCGYTEPRVLRGVNFSQRNAKKLFYDLNLTKLSFNLVKLS